MDVTDRGTASGTPLQQWSGTSDDGNKAQLFIITFIQLSSSFNYYTIRPLTNCGQGVNIPEVGEENESGGFDDYYDLDSDIVVAQANTHGEY